MDVILIYQIGNLLAYIFMLAMRILAAYTHFAKDSDQILRHRFPIKIMPAEWTFSIWFLILFLLGIFAVFQALPRNRREGSFVQRIGWLFMINAICNGLWVVGAWYDWLPLTTFSMVVMLITLMVIYLRLWTEKQTLATSWDSSEIIARYWLVEVPFSIYFGWIIYEALINISIQLYADPFKWQEGPGRELWAVVLMVLVFGIGLLVLYLYADVVFGLVIIWGLAGIAHRQKSHQILFVLAIIFSVFLGFSCLFAFGRKMRENFAGRGDVLNNPVI